MSRFSRPICDWLFTRTVSKRHFLRIAAVLTRNLAADGIKKVLHKTRSLAIEDAMQSLFDASNAFTEGSGRHDDTSIVILERITNSSLAKK